MPQTQKPLLDEVNTRRHRVTVLTSSQCIPDRTRAQLRGTTWLDLLPAGEFILWRAKTRAIFGRLDERQHHLRVHPVAKLVQFP